MGSICANNFEKEEGTETIDTYKNTVQLQAQLGEKCTLLFILGHYKQHRSEAIMAITEQKHIQHCDPIRDYTNDPQKVIEVINNMRKSFYKPVVNKHCPYRKLLICVLPSYVTEDREQYIQQFRNMIRQALDASREITVEFMNTIESIHTIPNQILLNVMFDELSKVTVPTKVNLITTEKKMMNLYRFQLLKTEAYTLQPLSQ